MFSGKSAHPTLIDLMLMLCLGRLRTIVTERDEQHRWTPPRNEIVQPRNPIRVVLNHQNRRISRRHVLDGRCGCQDIGDDTRNPIGFAGVELSEIDAHHATEAVPHHRHRCVNGYPSSAERRCCYVDKLGRVGEVVHDRLLERQGPGPQVFKIGSPDSQDVFAAV